MESFLYIMLGFAIGYEAGRRTAGQKCDWERALASGAVALVIAAVIVFLFKQFG